MTEYAGGTITDSICRGTPGNASGKRGILRTDAELQQTASAVEYPEGFPDAAAVGNASGKRGILRADAELQ